MKNLIALLLGVVTLVCPGLLSAQPLVYERFEHSAFGTVQGQVTFVGDVVGWGGLHETNRYAARFDGQPDTCIDYGPDKKVSSTDFTVEAFVKASQHADYVAIAGDWCEEGDHRSWAFVVTPGGGLRFDVSPDGRFHAGNKLETAPRRIEPDCWYHVAAVSQGDTSRIYVNGQLTAEGRRALSGIFTDDHAHLKIGNVDHFATQGPRPWLGWLDEVRITPAALAPADFVQTREPMPVLPGPVPARYEMPFVASDAVAAQAWQTDARARLLALVERQLPRRSSDEVPLDFQLGEPQDKAGYRLYPASFQGNDGNRIRCLFAVPDGEGPFPAMLALHGHGGSGDVVFDPTSIYHGLADRFARGGYVVLAPSFPHRQYCATNLWDLFRLVDILQSRQEVDRERLGVAGLSMGGEWTMWSAACDPRLKAAVVSGWMCTTEGVFAVPNCACWELPGFVELMDVCEVHLLIAPRPLLLESAERDECFPIAFTRQGFTRLRAGYCVFGAAEGVQQDIWPAGHEWHGEVAYPFIDKALGGRAAAVAH
ncbi:MAG: LamG-like jellyroll fold domain-containing protein [Pirellulaceae bacterium]